MRKPVSEMTEIEKQYARDRWYGPYSDTFYTPKKDSFETEIEKLKILRDTSLSEAQKWHKLAKLCLTTQESFYVPTMSGCYCFQYYPKNDNCRIRYAYATIDDNILPQKDFPKIKEVLGLRNEEFNTTIRHSNQYIFRFGLNTHMLAPAITMDENGELSMTPDQLMHEYVDFAPDPIVSSKIVDLPYNSLVTFGNPDKVEGIRGLKESAGLIDGFEFSIEQQEFMKKCTGFYLDSHYYKPVMALMNHMKMLAEFNVMKHNFYEIKKIKKEDPDISNDDAVQTVKDNGDYWYICPDPLCMRSKDKLVVDEWRERDLGISAPEDPGTEAHYGFDDWSAARYIAETEFLNKAISEFWYQKANNKWYKPVDHKDSAKLWLIRSKAWNKENVAKLKEDSLKALEDRIENEKRYVSMENKLKNIPDKQKKKKGLIQRIMDLPF